MIGPIEKGVSIKKGSSRFVSCNSPYYFPQAWRRRLMPEALKYLNAVMGNASFEVIKYLVAIHTKVNDTRLLL